MITMVGNGIMKEMIIDDDMSSRDNNSSDIPSRLKTIARIRKTRAPHTAE